MAPQVSPPTALIYNYLFSKAGHGGHHQRHHPFLFILINKDIIKGSFPFRKTFRTPKSDFEARFRPPRVSCRPEEPEQNGRAGTKQRRGKPARPEKCPTAPRVLPTGRTGAERQSWNKTAARETCPTGEMSDRPACPADRKNRSRTAELEQNDGDGKFSSPKKHFNPKNILSLSKEISEPDYRRRRPVRQKVRF